MNILFISTEIWSDKNPEGIVARRIANSFVELGYNVTVLTVRPFESKKLRILVIENRLNEFIDKITKTVLGLEKLSFIKRSINKHSPVLRDIKNLDLVITRSAPICVHLLGIFLKKEYGIKHIAMFSDLGFLSPYYDKKIYSVRKFVLKKIEEEVFKNADAITHTNSYALALHKQYFNTDNKFFVYPNPLSSSKVTTEVVPREDDKGSLNLAYIGSFYGKRTPNPLFDYMAKLKKKDIKLFIIGGVRGMYYEKRFGKISDFLLKKELNSLKEIARKYGIVHKVEILPFMSEKELYNFVRQNIDILVNVDAPMKGENPFLPSKIVEYLKFNLPILNFSNEGATSEFLESVGIEHYISYDNPDLFFDITDFDLNQLKPNKKGLIKQYEAKNLTQRLLEQLKYI